MKTDVASFESFIDYVSKMSDVGMLAILGDFVDMWRRDVSGLFRLFDVFSSNAYLIISGIAMKAIGLGGLQSFEASCKFLEHDERFFINAFVRTRSCA